MQELSGYRNGIGAKEAKRRTMDNMPGMQGHGKGMTWLLAGYATAPDSALTAKVPERNPDTIRYTAASAVTAPAHARHAVVAVSSSGNPPCGKPHCSYLTKTSIYHCPCKRCHG